MNYKKIWLIIFSIISWILFIWGIFVLFWSLKILVGGDFNKLPSWHLYVFGSVPLLFAFFIRNQIKSVLIKTRDFIIKNKSWLAKNYFKVGILVAILVVSYSFYYTLVKRPEIEKQREQVDRALEKADAKRFLNTCIADADSSYSDQWYRECKGQGELTNRCISLHEMTFDEYAKQNNIQQDKRLDAFIDFIKEKDKCSCRLPLANADRINKTLQDNKDECFRRYPQK